MSFIFCQHVGRVSQLLESTNPASGPRWASVITGLSADVVQAELDLFNGQQQPDSRDGMATALTRVSISHVDHAPVGVTGPSARLAELFTKSHALGASRHASLPISGGLCHVSNVYDDDNVRAVLRAARVSERWGSRPVRQPLLSPRTGKPFKAADAAGLIEAICAEALTKSLFFDKVAEGAAVQISYRLGSHANPGPPSSFDILHYRTSITSDGIVATVAERLTGHTAVCHRDLVDWVFDNDPRGYNLGNPGLPQDSKLAVVGMACRMPGDADTPEKFWELLVQGRNTMTEVPPDRFDLDAHFDPTMEADKHGRHAVRQLRVRAGPLRRRLLQYVAA